VIVKYLVPIIALLIGVIFALAVFQSNTKKQADSQAAREAQEQKQVEQAKEEASSDAPTPDDASSPTSDGVIIADSDSISVDASIADLGQLHPLPAANAETTTLGSVAEDGSYRMSVKLTAWGAGIMRIELARYHMEVTGEEPYAIQYYPTQKDANGNDVAYFPMAAKVITVNGQRIPLQNQRWHKDAERPGRYYLDLADESDTPRLRIVRHYLLDEGESSYDLRCRQWVENLTDGSVNIIWEQFGQTDLPVDTASYLGDRRMMMAGYFDPDYDASRSFIYSDKAYMERRKVASSIWEEEEAERQNYPPEPPVFWPNESLHQDAELVWVACLNRYFAATIHPYVDADTKKIPPLHGKDGIFPDVTLQLVGRHPVNPKTDTRPVMVNLTSKRLTIPAKGKLDLSLSLYAGPRDQSVLSKPPYSRLNLENMIIYELGCTMCTFQWLAHGLLAFLRLLHAVTFDWSIAIIILVLVVRAILHPITKKSQINMAKMGKQMQSMQPEIEKLKKKYANDQQKFQQEQMKLWREKGVNPANMLGCLPLLLQSPIWIALYAMLFFAIELRHQAGFYGMFQAISGGSWLFLADLSAPDNFIRFADEGFTIPLYFINPQFSGINVIPILMGVMFYFQQKFTMQPAMNEQQAQQQKMMKFMTLLFPVFLYSAPSGLTLYILASTSAGMVDSYFVRKHIKEQEEAGTLLERKAAKPGGLRDRASKWVERKMAEAQAMQQQREQGAPPIEYQRGNTKKGKRDKKKDR